MFEFDINVLKEQGLQLVDSAKKTALDLADRGKNQLDLMNQQNKMAKAERQLGALIYSLHKEGEENQPLVEKYLDAMGEIEAEIETIKARMTPEERAEAEEAEQAEAAAEEPIVEQEEEVVDEYVNLNATKVCPLCGFKVDTDALFCNHCGAQL